MSEKGEVRGVSPLEAKKLVDSGYSYVDVRSELEFRSGHPTGAVNVPFPSPLASGAPPSSEFLSVIAALFAREQGLVVGCATGVRSRAAVEALTGAGFGNVVELRAGFDGRRSAFGQLTEPGWRHSGLPVSTGDGDASLQRVERRS